MNRFDAQTLAQAGPKDKTFEMIFEDAKGNRFNLSIPNHVALALIPVLNKLKTTSKTVGDYYPIAQEWRTARDIDSPNVVLEIKGQTPLVFPLERRGPTNLDSRISVISARRGDGIARWDGEEDDQEIQTQSRGGIQGQGRFGGGTGREDGIGTGRAVRGAPDAGHAVEAAIA